MIIHKGDITNVTSGIVVHGCNAQGVMGSGVAKAIRSKWPSAFRAYRGAHLVHGLKLGEVIYSHINEDLAIANAITQDGYGYDKNKYVSYQAIEDAMILINERDDFDTIHIPKIGAGLGGGDWNIIKEIITDEVTSKEIHLWVL